MPTPHPDETLALTAGELDSLLEDVLNPQFGDEFYRAGRFDGVVALHRRIIEAAEVVDGD